MMCAGPPAAADLGRMFFTPAQRATLDNARKQNIRNEVGSENAQAAPVPQNVSVNGVVRRSDGKNTVWINNRAVGAQQARDINVAPGKNDNRVKLTVPQSGHSFELKVGQTADTVSGTITEGYARRTPLPEPEARATPPVASPPVKSANIDSKRATRAGERNVPDDILPDNGLEPK
jgi:hypothetical protein